jgi:hypothetical protein
MNAYPACPMPTERRDRLPVGMRARGVPGSVSKVSAAGIVDKS